MAKNYEVAVRKIMAAFSSADFNKKVINSELFDKSEVAKIYAILRYRRRHDEIGILRYFITSNSEEIIRKVKRFKSSPSSEKINVIVDDYRKKEHYKNVSKTPVFTMTNEEWGFQTCSV